MHVVETHVRHNSVVAVGSGPLVNYCIEDIGARLKDKSLENVAVIATNDVAASEASFHGVPQTTLAQCQKHVDLYIEQADEVDCACGELPYVAGRVAEPIQPALHQMRGMAAVAAETVVVLDDIGYVFGGGSGTLFCVVSIMFLVCLLVCFTTFTHHTLHKHTTHYTKHKTPPQVCQGASRWGVACVYTSRRVGGDC